MAEGVECAFLAMLTRQLRKLGFEGAHVWVGIRNGKLDVIGEKAGRIVYEPSAIVRLRIGYEESKSGVHFQMLVWRQEDEKPLCVYPLREHWASYRQTARLTAARVAGAGGLERVERGTSKVDAYLGPVLIGLLALAAIWIAVVVLVKEPWWGRMIVPAVPVMLLVALLWRCWARALPRPVKDLAELDRQLP